MEKKETGTGNPNEDAKKSIIYFLSIIGFFAIFSTTISKSPVLPLYAKALGGTEVIIGLVSAISPIAGIVASFPIGVLADRIGKKKLLLISASICVVAPLLYLSINSPWWLIPIRFFHGFATAILGPVASTVILESYKKSKGEMLGIYTSATLIGRAMAPLAGGAILTYFALSSDFTAFHAVYLAAFAAAIIVFILVLFLKIEKKGITGRISLKDFYISLQTFVSESKLFFTALVEMVTYFAFGAFETFLPLYLSGLGFSAQTIGLVFSVQVLSIAFSKPLFGWVADHIDKRVQITIGILIIGASIAALPFMSSIWAIFFLSVVFGLGISLSTIATSTYIADIAKEEHLGSSIGALSSIMDIGHSTGPFITGLVVAAYSFKAGFGLSLVLCVIIAVMFSIVVFRSRRLTLTFQ